MNIGIDAISFDIPKIYLPIKDLAVHRDIAPAKLEKGLGLIKMSFPDIHQDAVVFAGNALKKLIDDNNIQSQDISRIYVGTESGVDGSKPIASFLVSMIEDAVYESGSLDHCDAVDLTFACIGAVDALQNCCDYVKANPTKKAIVIATDLAKYDLASPGEYTQGAGAVAMLVSSNPRILAFENTWTVSTAGVFDFFKPRRTVSKNQLGIQTNESWQEVLETEIEIFKEQPVFDGQYSNKCYVERTNQAYHRLAERKQGKLHETWSFIAMHLPYCFQARRMFVEIFISEDETLKKDFEKAVDKKVFLKKVSTSEAYQKFVKEKIYPTEIASGQIGNMYTASIFMALLSALSHAYKEQNQLTGETIGFLAYGSGAKSKVFEAVVQPEWQTALKSVELFKTIEDAQAIDVSVYEKLHKKEILDSIKSPKGEFALIDIETENPLQLGKRNYQWIS